MNLDATIAERFATIALGHVAREFPHKLDHVWNDATDGQRPRDLHPVFFGSFDWHSCVHGWWLLLTLRARFPELAAQIDPLAATTFTPAKLAVELAYLDRPNSGGFERPYGWAWLLALHGVADGEIKAALEPLARAFSARFAAFLTMATYPIRTGSHANTAFACVLAHNWALQHDHQLAVMIVRRLNEWFGNDRDAQGWEPDGDAFLSPILMQAVAMSRALDDIAYAKWFARFLPHAKRRKPACLFTPAVPSDRSDGKIAHLDGLNFSRAWCWRLIAKEFWPEHPVAIVAQQAAASHIAASIDHVAGDYAGEHWLATFAALALYAKDD